METLLYIFSCAVLTTFSVCFLIGKRIQRNNCRNCIARKHRKEKDGPCRGCANGTDPIYAAMRFFSERDKSKT